MTQRDKARFRRTSKWHEFKDECFETCKGVDVISQKMLTPRWELHHLNLNESQYEAIGNVEDFVPMNKDTHTLIHLLYPVYKEAMDAGNAIVFEEYIARVRQVLNEMYKRERV